MISLCSIDAYDSCSMIQQRQVSVTHAYNRLCSRRELASTCHREPEAARMVGRPGAYTLTILQRITILASERLH